MARKSGSDRRGSSRTRRARKLYLLYKYGDGKECRCTWCHKKLVYKTLTMDRYPLCGHKGGGYNRENIVPTCRKCNVSRCIVHCEIRKRA